MHQELDISLFPKRQLRRVTQTTIAECGLACLAMVASFHSLDVDLATLRQKFKPSTRGITLRALMQMSDQMGLSSRAVQLDLHEFGALTTPAILHWDMSHFVVLQTVKKDRLLIHDPGGTSKWMHLDDVSKHFTGVALELSPLAEFQPGDFREKLRLNHLWSRIHGVGASIGQVILLSLLLQVFALSSPYFVQLAVDLALRNDDLSFLFLLAAFFATLILLSGITFFLRASVLLSLGSLFGTAISSNIARKLFRLPIDWFYRRHVGDILSRFQSVIPIRKLLAEDAPAAIVDGMLVILTLIVMTFYSGMLVAVVCLALSILLGVRIFLFRAQEAAQEEMLIAAGREQSVMIETLRGIRSLRLSGQESLRHALWRSRMTESVNATINHNRFENFRQGFQLAVFGIENIVTITLAVSLVMEGQLTIGMVMAFLAYKALFFITASALLDRFFEFKMLGLHLDRLADITLVEDDVGFTSNTLGFATFQGKVELRDVFYRYGRTEPFVLKGANLSVGPGETIALTGPSGGGKSTLAHLLLGLFEPHSGSILIDGRELGAFGYSNYHRQVGAVLQDDTLFAGSLGDNISMFDDAPDMDRLVNAATSAAIFEDISAMPMGFNTLVGDMGNALSGGQQQRVMIARALYRQPKLLVMDEATSHLDADTERCVNNSIQALGVTRILIAHRRSTIEMADRVFRLSGGHIT